MFKYSAPRLFNELPNNVKCSDNTVTLKKRLKTFIFMDCYDIDEMCINEYYAL